MKYLFILLLTTCGRTPEQNYLLGKLYANDEKYIQAEQYFTKAIYQNPNYVAAYIGRASVNFIMDSFASAVRDYSKVIELQPLNDNGELYFTRGTVYHQWKKDSLACGDFYTSCEIFGVKKSCSVINKICK